MFHDAFHGKVVLVTGNTGFKGSWLSIFLQHLGATVIGYALEAPTQPNLFGQAGLANKITHYNGDIRDTKRLQDVLEKHQPNFIFHLAAQPIVIESYVNPQQTFDINVMGTTILLEVLRSLNLSCVLIIVSSDKCYENHEKNYAYREDDPLGGHDPYSASKAAMEIVVSSYRRSFFTEGPVRVGSVRAGNVIGGGDWAPDRILPDAIRALTHGQIIQVRHPHSVRPWQHVLEPLSGYLWLAACLAQDNWTQYSMAWNFGPTTEATRTVQELVETALLQWKKYQHDQSGRWAGAQQLNAPHEAHLLMLNIDKAREELDWQPSWDFEQAVEHTVAWYAQMRNGTESSQFYKACLSDIEGYIDKAVSGLQPWVR